MSEKTCVVDGRREASTVDAMRAAFVEREAGNLWHTSRCFSINANHFDLLDAHAASVIEKEDVDAH